MIDPREPVTILTPTLVTDPYSGENTRVSWATPTETPVLALAPAEPRPVAEDNRNDRNSVTAGWTLYLPPGTLVDSGDRVRVRGAVYDILGEPAVWPLGTVVQTQNVKG